MPTSASGLWGKLERISKISAQVTIVVGVIGGLYGIVDSIERGRVAERDSRLQSLGPIQKFIEEDFIIQQTIDKFDYGQLSALEQKAALGPGRDLYFTNPLSVATIGEHYERIGAELKLNYLSFDLVYEVIPFPDEFWERTRPLRTKLRENWDGKGKSLPDLWSNFSYLCDLYRAKRQPEAGYPERTDVKLCKQ